MQGVGSLDRATAFVENPTVIQGATVESSRQLAVSLSQVKESYGDRAGIVLASLLASHANGLLDRNKLDEAELSMTRSSPYFMPPACTAPPRWPD